MRLLLFAAALAALAPAGARADGTAACHCFRDRTFDPARPAAVDPYLLATTRSSVLSAAFGPGKAALVTAVMSGTASEDLWIAHWAGARAGKSAETLLERRRATISWRTALAGVPGLGAELEGALARGSTDAALEALAVDDVLATRLRADPESLRQLRAAGASSGETILAAVLAAHLGTPTAPLVVQVKAGRATWGTVLRDAGLAPGALDALVRSLVR
jgi:hypothetical protein